jgi:hypothetical protein
MLVKILVSEDEMTNHNQKKICKMITRFYVTTCYLVTQNCSRYKNDLDCVF